MLAILAICLFSAVFSGCTITASCYGYGCGMPYDHGIDATRMNEEGTEQGTYMHYRPGYF